MHRSTIAALLSGVVVSATGAAGDATAATVRVDRVFNKADPRSDMVVYRAGSGEANDLVLANEGPTVLVTDRVPIAPGRGCASEAETVVRCSVSESLSRGLDVSLSDLDDRVRGPSGLAGDLAGGPGDDLLVGSPDASTTFRGGRGDDRMVGGAASDVFFGEPGSDTMRGGDPNPGEPVLLDDDTVDYGRLRAAVHADLEGDRDDGVAGERDRIAADVESLYGGHGPDVLIGGPARNSLEGNEGRDTLAGGGGQDRLAGDANVIDNVRRSEDRLLGGPGADGLQGGSGADRIAAGQGRDWIDAGPGRDRLRVRDGFADVVECGGGRDAARQDGRDFLLRGCERHGSRQPVRAMPIHWVDAGSMVSLFVACPSGRTRSCDGQVTIEGDARLHPIPRAFSLAPGSLGWVYIPLEGRTSPDPSLKEAVLVMSSTDARGRPAERHIALRDVPDDAPLPSLGL